MDKDHCVLAHPVFGLIWKCHGHMDNTQAQANANSNQLSNRQHVGEFNETLDMHATLIDLAKRKSGGPVNVWAQF